MINLSKLNPTKKSNPCPVCSNTSGKCRTQDALVLCGNLGNGDAPIGYRYVRPSSGIWEMFAPDTQSDDWQTRLETRVKRDRLRQEQQAIERAALPSLESRHKLLSARTHTLTPNQNSDLLRRGLTQSEIDFCLSHSWLWQERGGYGIGAIDPVTGFIVGGQLAKDDRSPKYQWLLPGQTHLPETGQNPLAVWISPNFDGTKPYTLHLSEGFLKPLISALKSWRSDSQQIWIGAAGGQFQDAALSRVLSAFPNATSTTLYPDGGAVVNLNTMRSYRSLSESVPSLQVAWWGQISKSGRDCDELTGDESIELLTWKQFEQLAPVPKVAAFVRHDISNRLANRVKRTPDRNIGNREFKDIAHELPTSGIVVLVGAKGTGKSEAIGIMKGDRSWLSITHRRSIGRDQAVGWDGVFLQDGDRIGSQALKPDGSPASGAAVCFPSLLGAEQLSRDVAIFDETTAGLEFLLGSKLCNKDGIRPLLMDETEKTVRNAPLLILADADMTEETIAYFEAIRGERAYVVQSERQPLGYVVYNMTEKKNAAIGEFLRQAVDVPDGKFIYLNSDSKTLVNALEVALAERGVKVLTFTQDNSGERLQRSLIEGKGANLHEFAMMGIKVFLSSPSITQGFSLTHNTDRIISRWGIYTGGSISAQDMAQAPDRIRSDAPLYLWVAERGSAYSRLGRATNQDQFLKDFESVSTTSARLVRKSLSMTAAAIVDGTDYKNRNLSMLASIEVSRNLGMVALRDTVLSHLRLEGKQIENYTPLIDVAAAKLAGKTISAASSKLKADHAAAVEAAADLTDDEAKALEKKAEKKALSLEERLSVEKYYLAIFYRLEMVKAIDVILDCDGRTRQQVRNLERILDAGKATTHTAESIDRNASTPQDWSKSALQSWLIEQSGAGDLIRKLWSGEITELTDELIEPIHQFSLQNPHHFEEGFGWGGAKNISAMKTIGVLLDWVGIARQSRRHRSEGKISRVYSVKADRLEWLKSVVERRSQGDPHIDNLDVNPTCGSPQNTPTASTEWLDFIKSERQKSHTTDSLRVLRNNLNYVPSQVWEAIAA